MTRALPLLSVPGMKNLAAEIWAYAPRTLTQAVASVVAAMTGSNITVYRGTSWAISLTGLGSLVGYSKIYFSVKRSVMDADVQAEIRVSTAGLERVHRAAPVSSSNGLITVDEVNAGNLTITLDEVETQNTYPGTYLYDIKLITLAGEVSLLSSGGFFTIVGDITRQVT